MGKARTFSAVFDSTSLPIRVNSVEDLEQEVQVLEERLDLLQHLFQRPDGGSGAVDASGFGVLMGKREGQE